MSSVVVNVKDFNVNNITFGKLKPNPKGGESVSILYNKQILQLEVPLMMTWGIQNSVDQEKNIKPNNFEMGLQFPSDDYPDAKGEVFLQKMIEFEKFVKENAVKNSSAWFKDDDLDLKTIEKLTNPMLAYPKDKQTGKPDKTKAPTLKLKVPYYENVFKIEIYDANGTLLFAPKQENDKMPPELIQKYCKVACLITFGGLWFVNGKMSITWRLHQCVVKPQTSLEQGKCHINLSEDDKKEIEKTTKQSDVSDDSEDEGCKVEMTDSEEEEVPDLPEPPKVVEEVVELLPTPSVVEIPPVVEKKKVVRKLKK